MPVRVKGHGMHVLETSDRTGSLAPYTRPMDDLRTKIALSVRKERADAARNVLREAKLQQDTCWKLAKEVSDMPYCPNCRAEYVEGVETCPDCGIDLAAELAPTEMERLAQEEIVPIYYPKDEMEAKIVKGALEAEGISAWEAADLTTEMFPFDVDTLGTDAIGVLASQADQAKQVIEKALELGEKMPTDEAAEVEGTPPEA